MPFISLSLPPSLHFPSKKHFHFNHSSTLSLTKQWPEQTLDFGRGVVVGGKDENFEYSQNMPDGCEVTTQVVFVSWQEIAKYKSRKRILFAVGVQSYRYNFYFAGSFNPGEILKKSFGWLMFAKVVSWFLGHPVFGCAQKKKPSYSMSPFEMSDLQIAFFLEDQPWFGLKQKKPWVGGTDGETT